MERRYIVADVFTDLAFGGNPLAVYLDGEGLTTPQMQAIAREMNLSETTFVTPGSAPGRFAVRIFTPANELPFAGHPTIGTAVVLAETGATGNASEIVLEEGAGPIPVTLRPGGATLSIAGPAERREAGVARRDVAAALGLDEAALKGDLWQAGYGGVAYLYVALADVAAVERAWLRAEAFAAFGLWAHGAYVYTSLQAPGALRARCFVPGSGVPEDPATGSAAAGYAGSFVPPAVGAATLRCRINQGIEMGRPSVIETATLFADGKLTTVEVGGGAVIVAEGRLLGLP